MTFSCSSASVAVLACFTALAGCSSGAPVPTCVLADAAPPGEKDASDAGVPPTSKEALPDDGPAVVRNDPTVRLVNVSATGGSKLRLKSSNLTAPSPEPLATRWWYAEVINEGDAPACYVHADVMAKDAQGRKVVAFDTYASAAAYGDTLFATSTSPCIPPGKSGYFDGVEFVDGVASNPVSSIEYAFDFSATAKVAVDDGAPTVTNELVAATGGLQELRGSVTAKADVHDVTFRAFSFDENGLIVDSNVAHAPNDLAAGTSWAFTLTLTPRQGGTSTSIVRVEPIVEYLRGLSPR